MKVLHIYKCIFVQLAVDYRVNLFIIPVMQCAVYALEYKVFVATSHCLLFINMPRVQVLITLIICIVRKTCPILLLLVGLTAGRQTGRQNTDGFQIFLNFVQVKLFRLLFCLLSLQCCDSIRAAFQSAFVNQGKHILRCVLKCEKSSSHFFMSIPTMRC